MILANISAARFVEKAKEPALFRIHDKPSTEAITSFRSVLAELGLELPGGNKPEPRDYAELLESVADRCPDAEMLQTMLLRSMNIPGDLRSRKPWSLWPGIAVLCALYSADSSLSRPDAAPRH